VEFKVLHFFSTSRTGKETKNKTKKQNKKTKKIKTKKEIKTKNKVKNTKKKTNSWIIPDFCSGDHLRYVTLEV